MTLLGLGLVVAVAALGFSIRSRGHRSPAPILFLLILYLTPALFILGNLVQVQDELRLRFSLLGLGFKAQDSDPLEIEIGGDRTGHEVWISAYDDGESASEKEAADRRSRLSQGKVTVRLASGETSQASLELEANTTSPPGLLGWRRAGKLQPVRSIELQSGDRLWIGDRSWSVELGGLLDQPASFTSNDGIEVVIPRRKNALPILQAPLPVLRAAPPGAVTYPVAWLEKAAGGQTNPTTGDFFYLLPRLFGHQLFLSAITSDIRVERNGIEVEIPAAQVIPAGDRLHALGNPRWDGEEFQAGGIRDLRSFRLQPARRALALLYDTPEIFALSWSDLVELSEPVQETTVGDSGPEALRVHLSMGGWQLTDRSLYFRHASLPVALESLAILEFPLQPGTQELTREATYFTAATPRGQVKGRFGEPLWLGEHHLAAIQIDRIQPPIGFGIAAVILALIKLVAARAVRMTLLMAFAAATLEGLLSIRLLLGFQAWAMPPFAEEPYALAIAAWAALPWTFLVILFPVRGSFGPKDVGRAILLGSGLLFSLAICLRLAGGGFATWLWIALHGAAAAVPILRSLDLGHSLAHAWERLSTSSRFEKRAVFYWCVLAFIPTGVRAGLFLFGFRESLQLGRRIALSLVHVPLALLLQSLFLLWLWRQIEREQNLRIQYVFPVLAFLGGTWLIPALLVSDLGLALLNMPVFLLALAGVLMAAQSRLGFSARRRAAGAATTVGLLLLLLVLPIGARLVVAVLPESLAESLYSERNFLRLLDFANPEKLEGVARRTSEELAVMAAVLRSYTTVGLTGRGYLETEVSPHLRSTALREHVPAVFIASQWGWAGATGLVLLLMIITGCGQGMLPNRLPDRDVIHQISEAGFLGTIASLAAFTMAIPSLYMILANYRLALFTGKNAYLLGLDSTADVLESCLLLLLTGLGAAAVRDG